MKALLNKPIANLYRRPLRKGRSAAGKEIDKEEESRIAAFTP